jgi:hypothetical protein
MEMFLLSMIGGALRRPEKKTNQASSMRQLVLNFFLEKTRVITQTLGLHGFT